MPINWVEFPLKTMAWGRFIGPVYGGYGKLGAGKPGVYLCILPPHLPLELGSGYVFEIQELRSGGLLGA